MLICLTPLYYCISLGKFAQEQEVSQKKHSSYQTTLEWKYHAKANNYILGFQNHYVFCLYICFLHNTREEILSNYQEVLKQNKVKVGVTTDGSSLQE